MSYITPASFDPNVPLNVNISGQSVAIGSLSGTSISTSVSGQSVLVSGNVVNVSGQPANVSGNVVVISGQMVLVSGEPVRVSGETVKTTMAQSSGVLAETWMTITGASGGTILDSTQTIRVYLLQNLPTNTGNMHVGGANSPPHASKGFVLTPGSAVELNVENGDDIRAYATVSGEKVAALYGGLPT